VPYIEAGLARKPAWRSRTQILRIEAFGRKAPSLLIGSDRGGAISIPTEDPFASRGGFSA